MHPVRILVDSFADAGLTNAQMGNAREIVRRLDPERFHVSMFCSGNADIGIAGRRNTRLVRVPRRLQTTKILREFIFGRHHLLFYLKSSPAARYYLGLRRKFGDKRPVIGTIESQSDLRNEPTISPEAVHLWEQTILRSDWLFSNSTAVRQSLLKEYGLVSEVLPTGVDTQYFFPPSQARERRRPKVLYVGALRPFKHPHILVDAARRFPEADFALAGTGLMAADLQERVRHDQLGNIQFLGSRSSEQLRLDYQDADIFLFPSTWEGSPKVLLEAASSGLPVIARRNYRPETVIDGVTGFLVGGDEELFGRLGELIRDSHLRTQMGSAGRQHAQRFDWDIITRQWEAVFERLIVQNSRRSVA